MRSEQVRYFMGKLIFLIVILIFSGACYSKEMEYCDILIKEKAAIQKKLESFIKSKSAQEYTYELSSLFLEKNKLIKGNYGCYTYLPVTSTREGYSILDGAGGINVYPDTISTEPNYWYGAIYPELKNKPKPNYPKKAKKACIEGYSVVIYTITKRGNTKNIKIVEEWPENWGFGKSAQKTAKKLKYAPIIWDGEAIDHPDFLYKFTFHTPC